MKFKASVLIPLFSLCWLSQSCTPEPMFDDWQKTQILTTEPLRGLYFLNSDTGFIWGGRKNQSGFISRTTNGGQTWNSVWESSSKCVYTLGFTKTGKGIAGGDSLFMLQSHNNGDSWFFYWLADSVPMHSFNRPAFRSIASIEKTIVMTAGENFKKGVLYFSNDNAKTWSYKFYSNELADVAFLGDSLGLVVGNGLMLYIRASVNFQPQILPFQGDFWTDATPWQNGFLITARSSSIYFFDPLNLSLKKIRKNGFFPGDSPALNSISSFHEIIIAGGDQGYFCWSGNGGISWNSSTLPEYQDIRQVEIKNGFIWFVTSAGVLYQLPLQKIKPLN
ncbi:MAG: hypothetical protein HPY80_03730 [Bacteroidales bacterium]|nr:hypothetical protein [Bacteroidales bacterium]NPV35766.1 hypothetical protein [Bacteroidales bacterium]